MSKESNFPKYAIIVATSVIAAAAVSVYLVTRKKKVRGITSSESFINNRNVSWLNLSALAERIQTLGKGNKVNGNQDHPEGPNIGYNSDASWFGNQDEAMNKSDSLHSSHSKGEKLLGTYILTQSIPFIFTLVLVDTCKILFTNL